MADDSSLLDDGWGYGRKNFTQLNSRNSVTPSLIATRDDNTRGGRLGLAYSSGVMFGSAQGFGLLKQFNDYFAQQKETERAIKAMDANRVANLIRDQLAPGQRVTLVVDLDSGAMHLISAEERYVYNERKPPFEIRIQGKDDGVCRGAEVPDVTRFEVGTKAGQKEWLILDDGRVQSERPASESRVRDVERTPKRYHPQQDEL